MDEAIRPTRALCRTPPCSRARLDRLLAEMDDLMPRGREQVIEDAACILAMTPLAWGFDCQDPRDDYGQDEDRFRAAILTEARRHSVLADSPALASSSDDAKPE